MRFDFSTTLTLEIGTELNTKVVAYTKFRIFDT
jgi:hypothetical protein